MDGPVFVLQAAVVTAASTIRAIDGFDVRFEAAAKQLMKEHALVTIIASWVGLVFTLDAGAGFVSCLLTPLICALIATLVGLLSAPAPVMRVGAERANVEVFRSLVAVGSSRRPTNRIWSRGSSCLMSCAS